MVMAETSQVAKLREAIASGQAVFITGTGVSVAACGNQEVDGHKVATWMGLLEHGAHALKARNAATDTVLTLLIKQIRSGETDLMINAAETIEQRLRERSDGTFRGWLKDTIGKLKLLDGSLPQSIHALPGVLATLNYDQLLEQATERQPITWRQADAMQDALRHPRDKRDKVLHLHGDFADPESVVLGVSSYNAVSTDSHAQAVLRSFFIDRTVVFVGCGATYGDPNFSRLIAWGKAALQDVAPRHVVLCRESEVDAFCRKLSDAPWLQPVAYGATHADLVPFLQGLAPTADEPAAQAGQPALPISSLELEGYRQALTKQHGRLKLEGLDATTSDLRPLLATGLFIGPNVRECAEFLPRALELPKELQRRLREQGVLEGHELDAEALERHRRSYLDQSPRPVLEVVADPEARKLVVLGDPGSGKSLLLKVLALAWAEHAEPKEGNGALPLLIELRDYARLRHEHAVEGFLDYLRKAQSLPWHLPSAALEHWLDNNPSRVMFDGLDEVFDPALRREVTTAIHRFADAFPQAQILVTSRVIGFQHQSWRDWGFRLFMLQELDPEQREEFLSRWHRAAYDDAARGESKRALLAEAITHSPAIQQLSGNPLLLTMMAILNRTQELPRDRAELYSQCARLLLHQWKTEDAFATDPGLKKASLDYKDKRGLLMEVAWRLQASPKGLAGNLIEENDLEATLADGLRDFPDVRAEGAARALIEQLRGRNFILCAVGSSNYAFVHRTFLEYFCAEAIVDRFQRKQTLSLEQLKSEIFAHWPEETWHEVLTLVAGLIEPTFVQAILLWLLEQPDPDQTCDPIFLAARCVGEVRHRQALGTVESTVLERLKELTRFGPDYYDYSYTSEEEEEDRFAFYVRQRTVQLVGTVWCGQSATNTWLKTCAQSDDDPAVQESALQELVRGWREDPETLAILKTLAQSDEDWFVRQSALRALARGWKEDAETLAILKTLAQSNRDALCEVAVRELAGGWREDPETLAILKTLAQSNRVPLRKVAVLELARGWREDPETLVILKTRAQSDEDRGVRRSAVLELAQGWREDPETLTILKTIAQSDEDRFVRRSAVLELARGWREDPETLAILKTLAQSDEVSLVRTMALLELARGWREDPETLAILKTRAQSDEDSFVREKVLGELARGWKDDPSVQSILKAFESTKAAPGEEA